MNPRQHSIRLFEFKETLDSKECIAFIVKHMPLLRQYTLGFRGEVSEELQTFLQSQGLSVAYLQGELPIRQARQDSTVQNIHNPQDLQNQKPHIAQDNAQKHSASLQASQHIQARECTLWLQRVIRSGESIYHNGDIVIESQVNSGSYITAEGNLFLFKECSGSVEARGEFIICHKILSPTLLFQDSLVSEDILQRINQSSALFKMIFKKDDNVAVKDI